MKKLLIISSTFCLSFLFISCNTNKATEEIEIPEQEIIEEAIETTFIDDANAEETAADTSSTGVYQEEVIGEETSLDDALKSNNEAEVEKSAMSFCDCVKKNKKLSDIMMSDNVSDANFDKAMEELEAMKTGDCKIMFPDQSNLDEKRAHQQKVKRCLSK